MSKHSQREQIREHLKAGKTLTPLQALELFGCFRLSGRVLELRQEGLPIETTIRETEGGARIAEYKLVA